MFGSLKSSISGIYKSSVDSVNLSVLSSNISSIFSDFDESNSKLWNSVSFSLAEWLNIWKGWSRSSIEGTKQLNAIK
jgi:hypothetical protein